MKIDVINVNMTTIDEAGSNRITRRDINFFKEIDECFWYSLSSEDMMTYPLMTKKTSTPMKPPLKIRSV